MAAKILVLFYIAHQIGDYYLQNGTIAEKKSISYVYTLVHCLLYSLPFIAFWILFFQCNLTILIYILIIVLTHIPVDLAKCYLTIHNEELMARGYTIFSNKPFVYAFDQVIHINIIFIAAYGTLTVLEQINAPALGLVMYNQLLFIFFCFWMFQSCYVSVRIVFTENHNISNFYCVKDFIWRLYSLVIGLTVVHFGYLVGIAWVITSFFLKRGRNNINREFCDYTFGSGICAILVLALLDIAIKILML